MEEWVRQKILEALEKQPEHQLTQVLTADTETGEVRVLVVEQTEGQPPVIQRRKEQKD
jgi:hypothetical protein